MKLKLTLASLILLSVAALFLFSRPSEYVSEISSDESMMTNTKVVVDDTAQALQLSAMPAMSEPVQLVPTDIDDIIDPLTPELAVIPKSTQAELDRAVEALREAPPPSARALKAMRNAKPSPFIDAMPQALIDAEARPRKEMTQEQIQEAYQALEDQRENLDG